MPLPLFAPLAPLLLPIATFLGFSRNTSKQIDTNKEISKQQQVQQLKIAHLNIQAQKDLEEKRQQFQINLEVGRQRFQERMSNLGFKQQKTLREFDQAFQSKLRELDYEHQQKVEEFRSQVNVAINQKNLDFQAWKVEQEMGLQKELATFNRETQLAIAAYQRETALNMPEINKVYENWPLKNPPMQILNSHPNHLRIFISPPALDYDRFTNLSDPKNHNFPKIEGFLGGRLLKLLNQHYPRNDTLRPTQLLDDAWDSKRFCGSSSIVALVDRLESEPFMVLESRITLNKYLSLRVAYKGASQKNYFYDEIIPRFEYGSILLTVAKARTGEALLDNTQKIQIIPDDWEVLYEILEVAHCIVATWIADVHHLLYHNASPLLPQILPELVKELPDFLLTDANSLLVQLMPEVVKGYQNVFQALESTEQCYQVPELFLELAQGLASLENKFLAKELMDKSIQKFLLLRGVVLLEINSLSKVATENDVSFLKKLAEFYQSMGDNEKAIHFNRIITDILHPKFKPVERLRRNYSKSFKQSDKDYLKKLKIGDFANRINLYVTGRTGAGKTSLGNSLLDSQVMKSTGLQNCTDFIGFFKLAGNLTYFDLPGIGCNINHENINRVALLMDQLSGNEFSKPPVNPLKSSDELLIKDFSKCINPNIPPEEELLTVEHWKSDVQQTDIAPDIILYVAAPDKQFIDDDREYLGNLLEIWEERTERCIIIPVLNIFSKEDGTVLPTSNEIEYYCREISDLYQLVYPNEKLTQIDPIIQINSKTGDGIARITEMICKILPQEKISFKPIERFKR